MAASARDAKKAGRPIPPRGRALSGSPADIDAAAMIAAGDVVSARNAWRRDAASDRLIDIVDAVVERE